MSAALGDENELRRAVEQDPGAAEFVDLARLVSEREGGAAEAREILFRGLSVDPKNPLARLLLAKLFYLDGMSAFAVRELAELRNSNPVPALQRLIDAFGEFSDPYRTTSQVAAPAATAKSVSTESNEAASDDLVFGEVDIEADFDDVEEELKS
ncbi:MAG: hypothetical protein IT290_10465 [Deltaproteobacteria bacterium]|nr:hypothetical protein [Deltaproteobacteria bacterium]